jgi:hypothetical protein
MNRTPSPRERESKGALATAAILDEEGNAGEMKFKSGLSLLYHAALDTVSKWECPPNRPGSRAGNSVSGGRITVKAKDPARCVSYVTQLLGFSVDLAKVILLTGGRNPESPAKGTSLISGGTHSAFSWRRGSPNA